MSLLDVLRPSGITGSGGFLLPRPRDGRGRHPRDEATGLPGRAAFTAQLARATEQCPPGQLCLGLLALGDLDRATATAGRRWVEGQLLRAAEVLRRLAECDHHLDGYRIGAHTFALVLTATTLDEAFTIADAVQQRIERDADPLSCAIGLALLDGERSADPESLEIAADAALDQAQLLGRGRPDAEDPTQTPLPIGRPGGQVVAAADQTSGLRWIASRPSSTRSDAL
ncbi:MAG: diguanylate cyclase [Kineosporiaceae bacterium]